MYSFYLLVILLISNNSPPTHRLTYSPLIFLASGKIVVILQWKSIISIYCKNKTLLILGLAGVCALGATAANKADRESAAKTTAKSEMANVRVAVRKIAKANEMVLASNVL